MKTYFVSKQAKFNSKMQLIDVLIESYRLPETKTAACFGPPLINSLLHSRSISLDHFIRPKEHFRWNRDAKLFGRL